MQRYHIWTIGCQMNKADSERLGSALEQLGLHEAPSPREADVIVLNSCVVRQGAEDRVTGMLGLLKPLKQQDPQRILALAGCMVSPESAKLRQRFPQVDVFLAPQQFRPLLDLVGERMGVDVEGCLGQLVPLRPSVSVFVPVIQGCDKFCTFCIVPYRRGRERSRPIGEVVQEVNVLAQRGVKEVTLLGQNVDSYGHDLTEKPDLADLLEAVNKVDGLHRIRFLTSHPNDMTPRIIQAIARLDKACEHVNLPFQAGDDGVLSYMRRGYTVDQYRRLVAEVRDAVPGVALSTDLIVGFPGETEEQFQRSVELVQEMRFDKVHVAAYSHRPGTIASRKMKDDVSQAEKERRLHIIEEVQEVIAGEINAGYQGRTVEVLVDGRQRGKWRGRTRTDKLVFFQDNADHLGDVVRVKIEKTSPWALQGSLAVAARSEW